MGQGMLERMKPIGEKHKGSKWLAVTVILSLLLLMSIFCGLQIRQFDEFVNGEKLNYFQIAGAVSKGTDIDYAVIDALKGEKDKEAIEQGREKLSTYGYTEKYVVNNNETIKQIKKNIIINYFILGLVMIIVIGIIAFYINKKHSRDLEGILEVLDDFSKKDYSYVTRNTDEGLESKLYGKLEQLGKMISLTNERLYEEKEETKALVTDISHQLKTPLSALNMYFSLLSQEDLEKEEQEEFINKSIEQINRLEGLISALVNISRLEVKMIELNKEKNDIKETLIDAVNSVYMKAEEKKISIKLEKIQSVNIPHDKKWTKEAISNVLDNAIKYSPSDSSITINMNVLHNYLRIEIEDEGVGVKKEEYNEIFKRFYRGKTKQVKEQEGSGVGLYLSRKILEEQGGNIKVVSNKEVGSIFVLQLLLEQ